MQTAPKSSFFDKHTADILGVSFGALAIVIFLSIAFVWFDGSNLPPSNSHIGKDNHGVINHGINNDGENNQLENDQREQSEDLVATAAPTLPKMPFQFVSKTSASLSGITLNATLVPDNTMWR